MDYNFYKPLTAELRYYLNYCDGKYLHKQNFVLNLHALKVMAHGVMVTLRFLVPSFKVRVLVGQHELKQVPMSF